MKLNFSYKNSVDDKPFAGVSAAVVHQSKKEKQMYQISVALRIPSADLAAVVDTSTSGEIYSKQLTLSNFEYSFLYFFLCMSNNVEETHTSVDGLQRK